MSDFNLARFRRLMEQLNLSVIRTKQPEYSYQRTFDSLEKAQKSVFEVTVISVTQDDGKNTITLKYKMFNGEEVEATTDIYIWEKNVYCLIDLDRPNGGLVTRAKLNIQTIQ